MEPWLDRGRLRRQIGFMNGIGWRALGRRAPWVVLALLAAALPACDTPLAPSGLEWTLSPSGPVVLRPGATTVFTISIQKKANINAAVDLQLGSLPAGLIPSFTSRRLADTASSETLTIQAASTIELGTYTVDVTATEVGGSGSTLQARVSVSTTEGPDISLEVDPIEFVLTGTGGHTFTYYLRPLNGFRGVASITLSPMPFELVLSQPPSPASITLDGGGGAGGTFVLSRRSPAADRALVDITVTATSGSLLRTRRIRIRLQN